MDPDGNRLQNSCSPRHWDYSYYMMQYYMILVSGTTATTDMMQWQVWGL